MDFIEEVKYWVSKAKEADPELKVFGASKHKYQFDVCADMVEIRAFEQKHGLKLPENYVRVLTELGSGAGPYYGLYPLSKLGNDYSEHIGSDVTFLAASLTPKIWKQVILGLDKIDDDEQYDEIMRKVVANAVVIGTQGCTYDTILMCGGSENGKIINIDWNMDEEYPPHFTHMTFEDWYLGFFKEVAAKNNISWYGFTRLDTEEKLIADYEKATDLEPQVQIKERNEILSSLGRFQKLSSDTIGRLRRDPNDTLIAPIIGLILLSDEETGLAMFDEQFYSDHPERAIQICRSIPDEIKGRYYYRALEILYSPTMSKRLIPAIIGDGEKPCARSLLFFLGDCACRSAKDLIPFALDEQNPGDARGTTAYEICKCPDVAQYQTDIAELMHSNVYSVAFNAMQGAIRTKLREPVVMDAFRWMKEHYKDDRTIQSNLERIEGV